MKKMSIFLLSVLIMVVGLSVSAHATLVDMGDGTIYDTDHGFSWIKDANMASNGGNNTGLMTYQQAQAYIIQLNTVQSIAITGPGVIGYAGFTNWQLPNSGGIDVSSILCGDGYYYPFTVPINNHGDMQRLYNSLGNTGSRDNYCSLVPNGGLTHIGGFTNVQAGHYWEDVSSNPNDAWRFNFSSGGENTSPKTSTAYVLPVRYGERPLPPGQTVPASGTVGLIVLGLAGVITYGMRLRKAPR